MAIYKLKEADCKLRVIIAIVNHWEKPGEPAGTEARATIARSINATITEITPILETLGLPIPSKDNLEEIRELQKGLLNFENVKKLSVEYIK